jgi:hypothetical protein
MTNFSIQSFLDLFDELIIGSTKEPTWVIDGGSDGGLLGTVAKVNAREASEPVNQHDATIAGHTEHVRWALEYALTLLEGKKPAKGWSASWSVTSIGEKEWNSLQKKLREAYQRLRDHVSKRTDWPAADQMTGLLSVLPHTAYHLGAVRQMVIRL